MPLCSDCHLDAPDSQHRVGDERKFWARVGKDPDEIAARLWGQFVRRVARSPEKRKAVAARAKRILKRRKPMMGPGEEAAIVLEHGKPFATVRVPSRAKDPELYRYGWGSGRKFQGQTRWPPKGARKLRSRQ